MQEIDIFLNSPIYRSQKAVSFSYQILKEEPLMKTVAMDRRDYIPYPNAATRRQQLHKFLDKCLVVASAIGIVTILMFMSVLS